MATKPDPADKKRRAFEAALSQRLRERARLLLSSETEVLRTLVDARTQILATLTGQPSDWKLWQLSRLLGQIDDVLTGAAGQAGTAFGLRLQDAWNLGEDFVDKPLAILGHRVELQLSQLDATVLKQMRAFGTLRLRDVGTEALRKIGTELGLVTIGGKSPFDAIKMVQKILGNDAPQRAAAIVRTEVSRAFAVASNERLAQAQKLVPGMGKQWRRSGKLHSRWNHDLIDGQVVGAKEPFKVPNPGGGVDLMQCPHDPRAPIEQVIHCGCISLPWMKEWDVATPGAKPFTKLELQQDGKKAALDQAAKRAGQRQE